MKESLEGRESLNRIIEQALGESVKVIAIEPDHEPHLPTGVQCQICENDRTRLVIREHVGTIIICDEETCENSAKTILVRKNT